MKIQYDSIKLKTIIKQDVNNIKNKTSSILENIQSISIPTDFNRKSDIYATKSTLASVKSSLINYILWLENLESNFSRVEEQNKDYISRIPKKEVSKKERIL